MINSLVVGGLKSVREIQRIPLAPITLIYGPNSAGKSTVIQSLLLLSQSVTFSGMQGAGAPFALRMRGSKIDLGSFLSAVHRHDPGEPITLGVEVAKIASRQYHLPFYLPPSLRGELARLPPLELRVTFKGAASGTSRLVDPYLSMIQYSGRGQEPFALDFVPDTETTKAEKELDELSMEMAIPPEVRFGWRYKLQDDGGLISAFKFIVANEMDLLLDPRRLHLEKRSVPHRSPEDLKKELAKIERSKKKLLKTQGEWSLVFPSLTYPRFIEKGRKKGEIKKRRTDGLEDIANLLRLVGSFVEDALDSVSYLGPLRSPPERYYVVSTGQERSVGVRGQNVIDVLVRQERSRAMRLEALVSQWFKEFEIPYELKVRSVTDTVAGDLHVLELTDLSQKIDVSPSDVGFGFSQLLPILIEGLLAQTFRRVRGATNRTICVEQPEIHLHPKLQAHVADFLIDTAGVGLTEASPRAERLTPVQWIVETHSEALMLRIQRRIREGKIPPGAVSVIYVKHSQAGDSKIIPLELAENGDFVDEWPDGFFEEGYRERFPNA